MIMQKQLTTMRNLYKQYGVLGVYKGTINKLKKRGLLEGFVIRNNNGSVRTAEPPAVSNPSLFDALQYLVTTERVYPDNAKYSCTIVIPIYNGLEHLKRLFPSIADNTPEYIEVILINDCSPDPQIVPYINGYLNKHRNWKLIENEKNYGFVKTVNRGMKQVHTEYAILLNTDTKVPQNWIPKMLAPFMENERIATTTPFTNSGVYFSFPNFGVDNQVNGDLEEINAAFDHIISNEYGLNEVHSGTGFCMGVNMECWKQIGELDYENFGKGYGEENDWCFRALDRGWRHLLVPNLFVHHFHGGSFLSEEKKRLCEEHHSILESKYFNYVHEMVPSFQKQDPWKVYRIAAAIQMSLKKAVLYVNIKTNPGDISGAIDYSCQELEKLQIEDEYIIIAQYERGTKNWSIIPYTVDPVLEVPLDDILDLELLFERGCIRRVIVNNLAFCENAEKAVSTLTRLRKRNEFELVYKFHDYLSVCPSFFLIDSDHKPCDPLGGKCKDCLRMSNTRAVKRDHISKWRFVFDEFFKTVDCCQFFSEYSKSLVCKVYPQVEERAEVKYHSALLTGKDSGFIQSSYKGKWNIAFVGNFCMEKGAEYFISMQKDFETKGIVSRFIVIGENNSGSQLNNIEVLGKYTRENLGKILTENEVHFVLYPSINNETFSYVAQELMCLHVPFVVFPCGAPQERIRKENYGLAQIADDVSMAGLYDATEALVEKVYHKHLN